MTKHATFTLQGSKVMLDMRGEPEGCTCKPDVPHNENSNHEAGVKNSVGFAHNVYTSQT